MTKLDNFCRFPDFLKAASAVTRVFESDWYPNYRLYESHRKLYEEISNLQNIVNPAAFGNLVILVQVALINCFNIALAPF
jgi:hypothetical protein